jgi:hypothetical protein
MRIKVPQLPQVRFPRQHARRRSADGSTPGTLRAGILRVPRRIALALVAALVAAASLVSFTESYRRPVPMGAPSRPSRPVGGTVAPAGGRGQRAPAGPQQLSACCAFRLGYATDVSPAPDGARGRF